MKILVINTENSSAWNPRNFGDMFELSLKQQDDQWIHCNVALGMELLSIDDIMDTFQGIVITGSHFNVRDRDNCPWFDSVCKLIQKAALEGRPKIYGGCYGCQIIAHALGGQVDYNPSGRFVLFFENIQVFPDFNNHLLKYVKDANEFTSLRLIESHGDCVRELPKDSILLASSNSCTNEIWITGLKQNILACQSHPEFEYDYAIKERIWPSVVEKNHRLTEDEAKEAMNSFQDYNTIDSNRFCKIISAFLHNS